MKTITLYELLGLVKDGKAPKIIKYKGTLYEYDSNDEFYFNNGWSLYREFPENGNCLNDEVEILEEEPRDIEVCGSWFTKSEYDKLAHSEEKKKIPEKLDVLVEVMSLDKIGALTNEIGEIQRRFNQLIDYLKSKGE